MIYLILVPLFFLVMVLYIRIADHYNIIDHPNERSSHSKITIRGGGIIFIFAAFAAVIMHTEYWLPVLGIFIVGTISFLDVLITLSGKIRIFFQLVSVTLLFICLKIFTYLPFYDCIMLYILFIGIINAYNFMVGINGITGTYSIVIFGALQYINLHEVAFIEPDMIWLPIVASGVFLFYNFRTRAKCFAGDVGSVSIAFWVTLLLLDLIIATHNWGYILFLAVYGVDSIFTIVHRIILKQNIFKAHRLHFYQILANERKIPHLVVSTAYAAVQLLIIIVVIRYKDLPFFILFLLIVIPLAATYLIFKTRLMSRTLK